MKTCNLFPAAVLVLLLVELVSAGWFGWHLPHWLERFRHPFSRSKGRRRQQPERLEYKVSMCQHKCQEGKEVSSYGRAAGPEDRKCKACCLIHSKLAMHGDCLTANGIEWTCNCVRKV